MVAEKIALCNCTTVVFDFFLIVSFHLLSSIIKQEKGRLQNKYIFNYISTVLRMTEGK